MPTNDLRDTKFGTADHARFVVCADGHVHVIGFNRADEPEYEIVLGRTLMQRCRAAIDEAEAQGKVQ